jgi:protein-tyrosine phosphatase
MAEVVLRAMADEVGGGGQWLDVSSAGTGPWHEGEPMDPRARAALVAAGYRDHGHVAHQFSRTTITDFDLIVALDRKHLQILRGMATAGGVTEPDGQIKLLRQFDPGAGGALDVPDPYYGDAAEFSACLAMVEGACRGLVEKLATRSGAGSASD